MSKAKEIKDLAFLTAVGLGGAGISAWALRKIPGSGGELLSQKTRALLQMGIGTAVYLFAPSRVKVLKIAGAGMFFAGTTGMVQTFGFNMLAGPRRGTSSLTREQILYLQTTGRAPAMSGPQTMRSMAGPQTMRSMGRAGQSPSLMGRAGQAPGMMGFSRGGAVFRSSC